ncbi:MAG TPA: cytochrome c [Gammaproteobacteria bacterium]
MAHTHSVRRALVAASGLAVLALAQAQAPADDPAWTGVARAADVIAARQALMAELERLMEPIDIATTGAESDPAALREAAGTVATMLLAVPHLFPPTTNLYDPEAEQPQTLALPAIWENFDAFYAMATAASAAATEMAATTDPAALPDAARKLRASCDACHAPYLRPYVPRQVSEEDLNFDFDSIFQKD